MFGKRTLALVFVQASMLFLARGSQAATDNRYALKPQPRTQLAINEGWRFLPDDPANAQSLDVDDSAWTVVDLPHTWNAQDPFDDAPDYRRAPSWYRRTLVLGPQYKGKRLFLHFEGVHQLADVFVNGKPAGRHKGGYTAFTFDITDLVNTDANAGKNIIAVRADNGENDSIPPIDIGYAFYGGIYRDVWLVVTDPVHFDMLDYGSPGIYVDTPGVCAESSRVRLRGTVVNSDSKPQDLTVSTVVLDAESRIVLRAESKLTAKAGANTTFEQLTDPISSPKLWSPDSPCVYRVETTLLQGDKILDSVKSPLGFRWFKFDPEQGFLLNGKKYPLHGASRHQDFEDLGSALPNTYHWNDVQWLKQMGGNFLRLAHYPQEQEMLNAADQLGLVVWEEIPIVSTMSTSPEFAETSRNMLKEMIRQHYNHPSNMMWGYMNEVLLNWRRQKNRDENFPKEVIKLARELDALAHQEDPTRVTVMAMDATSFYDEAGISEIPQVAAWNIYSGWYSEGLTGFGKFLDRQREKYPKRCLIVSEYGAGSDNRLHSLKPLRFDHTSEYMSIFHESHWSQIRERPWLGGTLIWNEFDFSQPKAGDSIAHVNQKGMLTWDRTPKDVYYLYQANWTNEPVLHICKEWERRSGTNPEAAPGSGKRPVVQPVKLYSNLAEVELLIDEQSLGVKKPDSLHSIAWDVPFQDGWNTLRAKGRRGSQEHEDLARVHFDYYAPKLNDPSVPFNQLAVNVGSNAEYTDAAGTVWLADQAYVEGTWGFIGGQGRYEKSKESRASGDILGTLDEAIYQVYREGIEAFRFDVPEGDYELDLRFTEYNYNDPGKRIFRVLFNGAPLIDSLDLLATTGHRRAASKLFRVRVLGEQGATIKFEPIVGEPVLCGIRMRKLP